MMSENSIQPTSPHILKFLITGKPIRTDGGIKCYPRQTYGVSEESPEYFKGTHTIQGQNGYIYKHDNPSQKLQHFSQKKYFSIDHSSAKEVKQDQQFKDAYIEYHNKNSLAFHRKKGRLTEFMDKNGWMSAVVPIMGFQRSSEGRRLEKEDRRRRINSLKSKKLYENSSTNQKATIDQQYFQNRPELMSQKQQIRKKRNQLAQLQFPTTARTIFTSTIEDYQREAVQNRMAMTAREWASSTITTQFFQPATRATKRVSKIHNNLNLDVLVNIRPRKAVSHMTVRSSNVSPQLVGKKNKPVVTIEKGSGDHADDLYNKTAASTKWSKWVYQRKGKLDTDEDAHADGYEFVN